MDPSGRRQSKDKFKDSPKSKRFVDGFKTANIDGLKVLPNPIFRPRLAIFGIPVEKSESDLVSDLMENPVIAPQLINNSGGLKLVKLIRKEDNELLLTADKVNLSSSPGSDGMPPLLIVKLVKHFRTFFLSIFNKCLTTGHFPSTWKLGDVVLVPKRIGEDLIASHCPITMLPGLGKILERLILARLSWMADRMCKAPPNQLSLVDLLQPHF
ncbi:hypothetical protein LAZ67_5002695 [Cordylochernes scorpioides]|uniref:RNA-directed DNA polymerase from mobile element jockey n=1 Tax=Cordylochernes scorpioides TaxID=51811 RepID=A0ABY6KIG1_9ARAC|nr:hypothetical protein LAZ67_5002695 [Cordylochernes scorpioides]